MNDEEWKVGDAIPLGELDDSALISSWDLAYKEYNAFYSIDPAIRKKDNNIIVNGRANTGEMLLHSSHSERNFNRNRKRKSKSFKNSSSTTKNLKAEPCEPAQKAISIESTNIVYTDGAMDEIDVDDEEEGELKEEKEQLSHNKASTVLTF